MVGYGDVGIIDSVNGESDWAGISQRKGGRGEGIGK